MTDVNILRLMENLRIRLPGAVDGAIKSELYNVLNDWFQDTNMWREDIDIPVVANTTSYTLTPSSGSIFRLMGLVDNNQYPLSAAMDTPGEIELMRTPTSDFTATAQVALTVTDPTDREDYPIFPIWVLNKYQNDIINGVLGRMMAQAAKPYSNVQLALYHQRAFNTGLAFARQEYNRRNVYRMQVWRFPSTFSRQKTRR